jgi:hypothetical protein
MANTIRSIYSVIADPSLIFDSPYPTRSSPCELFALRQTDVKSAILNEFPQVARKLGVASKQDSTPNEIMFMEGYTPFTMSEM